MAPEGIVSRVDGEFMVHSKDDGVDYWRLVKACVDEKIDQDALRRMWSEKPKLSVVRDGIDVVLCSIVFSNPKRMVFRVEWEGREFILKRAFMGTVGLRRMLPGSMGITYFTRVMRKVDAAIRAGCRSTQGYYCVAERWLSPFRQEVWVLLECVPGRALLPQQLPARREAFRAAVEDLLLHRLTMDDLALGNFLDDGEAVRAIDVSCRAFTTLQTAKMRLKLSALYGLDLPARGGGERACAWFLRLRYRVREWLGGEGIKV